MGSLERRARERAEMRGRLIGTARAIAAEEGWAAVTIRAVADRLEYTSPVLYKYFPSKDALIEAVTEEGFAELLGDLRRAAGAAATAQTATNGLARAYWAFAHRSPELYQAMFGLGGIGFCAPEVPSAEEVFALVRDTMTAAAAADGRTLPDPDGAVKLVWSMLHGLIALEMAERLADDGGRWPALVDRAVGDVLRGMTRGPELPTPSDAGRRPVGATRRGD